MYKSMLQCLLRDVQNGSCSLDQALKKLRSFPTESITDACVDHQRHIRTGIPEVIYGAAKSAEQIASIAETILRHGGPIIVTKVDPEKAQIVQKKNSPTKLQR